MRRTVSASVGQWAAAWRIARRSRPPQRPAPTQDDGRQCHTMNAKPNWIGCTLWHTGVRAPNRPPWRRSGQRPEHVAPRKTPGWPAPISGAGVETAPEARSAHRVHDEPTANTAISNTAFRRAGTAVRPTAPQSWFGIQCRATTTSTAQGRDGLVDKRAARQRQRHQPTAAATECQAAAMRVAPRCPPL